MMRRASGTERWLVVPAAVVMVTVLAACGQTAAQVVRRTDAPVGSPTATAAASSMAVGPLVDASLDIQAPAIAIPLRLAIPSLHVDAPMMAVGQTKERYMDAPKGRPSDPVWQRAFWYRGGEEPGAPGTATIAGHVDDSQARPSIFANIQNLKLGDEVVVIDTRNRAATHFHVVDARSYSVAEATSRPVLERLYGRGAVTDNPTDRANDAAGGVSRLNLITCAGDFRQGQFDRRYVVYAVKDPG